MHDIRTDLIASTHKLNMREGQFCAPRVSGGVRFACWIACVVACVLMWMGCFVPLTAVADEQDYAIAEIGNTVSRKVGEIRQEILPPANDYTAHVGTIMQNEIMMGGCEVVSLGIALESMGIDVNLDTIVSDYLNMDGSISTGYSGDPYWAGAGFPPGIAAAANGFLEAGGYEVRAYDLTGSSFDSLRTLVERGYPVLVWTTMGFEDPLFSGMYDNDIEWYENEHCVVLYGFGDGVALVSDPLEGYVERDLARFVDIYEQCGSRAVVLY